MGVFIMKKLFVTLAMGTWVLFGQSLQAQTLVSSAFGEFSNSSMAITFTSGETVAGDFNSESFSFNSGFISSLDAISTSNELEGPDTPTKFNLSQNYPNPFNPSTKIQFSLPQTSNVRLEVYNSIGAKIAVLVDGEKAAGFHTVTFQANSYASGMYFYTLSANGRTISTKKMILIK